MDKRRARHGLALAGLAVAGAVAVAAALYGVWIFAIDLFWETARL